MQGELAGGGDLCAAFQRGLALHHVSGVLAVQRGILRQQGAVRLEDVEHSIDLVGDHEALARLGSGGCHRLVHLLCLQAHLGFGVGGHISLDRIGSHRLVGPHWVEGKCVQRDVGVKHQRDSQHALGYLLDNRPDGGRDGLNALVDIVGDVIAQGLGKLGSAVVCVVRFFQASDIWAIQGVHPHLDQLHLAFAHLTNQVSPVNGAAVVCQLQWGDLGRPWQYRYSLLFDDNGWGGSHPASCASLVRCATSAFIEGSCILANISCADAGFRGGELGVDVVIGSVIEVGLGYFRQGFRPSELGFGGQSGEQWLVVSLGAVVPPRSCKASIII